MKTLIVVAVTLGAVVAFAVLLEQRKAPAAAPDAGVTQPVTESASAPTELRQVETPGTPHQEMGTGGQADPTPASPVNAGTPAATAPAVPLPATAVEPGKWVVDQAVASLVLPQTGYEKRQAIWKELKKSGKLDQAVSSLEQNVAAAPQSADSMAALGEGYYKKAGNTEDVREKAIYAMKADQTLEAALNLDPSNWVARFTRTAGISYWPPELNKGTEVLEQFQSLIKQQETQPPQPQFAQTYLLLGEQYVKAGYPNYAAQVWQRGATLFPDNTGLREKLAAAAK